MAPEYIQQLLKFTKVNGQAVIAATVEVLSNDRSQSNAALIYGVDQSAIARLVGRILKLDAIVAAAIAIKTPKWTPEYIRLLLKFTKVNGQAVVAATIDVLSNDRSQSDAALFYGVDQSAIARLVSRIRKLDAIMVSSIAMRDLKC
jgi:formaldehyde-activating enzyme involved in methanogenesis